MSNQNHTPLQCFGQMKFNNSTQFHENSPRKTTNNIILFLLSVIFLSIIPIYIHKISPFLLRPLNIDINVSIYQENKHNPRLKSHKISTDASKKCNLFRGIWVPFPQGPYYTNETKCVMDNRQNCMKFGRPDTDYLKWRWKPDECELPLFDAVRFLEMVREKSMAFVGDSLARNQMQSLICLLTSVARPLDISYVIKTSTRWFYTDYNFTLAHLWTSHLIQTQGTEVYSKIPSNLTLDKPDQNWASNIEDFNYVIVSSGHWFLRPLVYYEKGQYIGCHLCEKSKTTNYNMSYAFKMAYRTTFGTILDRPNFKGTVFLRTITESHVDHRDKWGEEGDCTMTRPFTKREVKFDDVTRELLRVQIEEMNSAKRKAKEDRGLKFILLNIMEAMAMRPDGHPNRYGHWPHERKRRPDCLHWCLPGPVDLWNEILLEMLKNH